MSTALLTPEVAQPQVEAQIIAPHSSETIEPEGPRKRLISAHDYIKMAELGLFEGQRVELIGGEIIIMPPITEPHTRSVARTATKLTVPLHEEYMIRSQSSFSAGEHGHPQPDLALVRLDLLEDPDEIPSQATLIVEVSRSTLQYDRTTKLSLYASLGITDYWIINLIENCVEVHRQPIEREATQFGWDYASRTIYQRGQSVSLLEVPSVSILVDDVLP